MSTDSNINVLIGLTIASIKRGDKNNPDRLEIATQEGRSFLFYHSQDCCESVTIERIDGDLSDLIDSPILSATETIEDKSHESIRAFFGWPEDRYIESITLTTFAFETANGKVFVNWVGESNGYYSESVSFVETTNGQPNW